MYGPLWTMVCLIVCVPVFGNFGQYLAAWRDEKLDDYKANITGIWRLVAWCIVYFFVIPYVLHTVFRFGAGLGSIDSKYFFIASIYGYCFTPFVPAIIIHAIPNFMIQWASLLLPGISSLVFLTKELFTLAQEAVDKSKLKYVAGFMGILHLVFIVMLKLWFL